MKYSGKSLATLQEGFHHSASLVTWQDFVWRNMAFFCFRKKFPWSKTSHYNCNNGEIYFHFSCTFIFSLISFVRFKDLALETTCGGNDLIPFTPEFWNILFVNSIYSSLFRVWAVVQCGIFFYFSMNSIES